jgi:uncharacterized protein YukE
MAGQFTGMDIAAVRQLSQQMKAKADEIRNLSQQLTGQLQNTQWVGPDRDRFTNDWQSQHVAALNRVAEGLEAASQAAAQNATQQENASNS